MKQLSDIIQENRRRYAERFGAPELTSDPYASLPDHERIKVDFPFWAEHCVRIRHKLTGEMVPFRLNRPQRILLQAFEQQRLAGLPIRVILLKSRQWGGSTLTQMYMAWIQCVHRRRWNSYICAHFKDTASTIRGIYTRMLENYPIGLWDEEEPPQFRPFERSQNCRVISGRDCIVSIGSAENPEASRGNDIQMAHLSEVAFWRDSQRHAPDDFIRSVCSGIAMEPLTMVVLESTANGVGNFFHRQWLRAAQGDSAYKPVFIAWHDIDIYRRELSPEELEQLYLTLTDRERHFWDDLHLSLEQIAWYRHKLLESTSEEAMMAEYPTDDIEAFVFSASNVFARQPLEALRCSCIPPVNVGEVNSDGNFVPDPKGNLKVWRHPEHDTPLSYVIAVDIGGRSAKADWSVMAVLARDSSSGAIEVVAQWRGHIDHDLLARRAVALGRYYHNALLVVESNTLEQEAASGGSSLLVLEHLCASYPNLYRRTRLDTLTGRMEQRIGFHTNVSTKHLVIDCLIAAVREGSYTERDSMAVDEMITYEHLPGGGYAARHGHHDDILMTRAIALYVISTSLPTADPALDAFLASRRI